MAFLKNLRYTCKLLVVLYQILKVPNLFIYHSGRDTIASFFYV